MTVDTCEGRALSTVNAARRCLGHQQLRAMPTGRRSSPEDCSIQRALRDLFPGDDIKVYGSTIVCQRLSTAAKLRRCWGGSESSVPSAPLEPHVVVLPRRLRRFVREFDSNRIRHLVAA